MNRKWIFVSSIIVATSLFSSGCTLGTQTSASSTKASTKNLKESGVWVTKPDQAKSCSAQKGVELSTMGAELKKQDIRVYEQKKIHDSLARIQMCGTDKGTLNGFLISKSDIEKAKSLGFDTQE